MALTQSEKQEILNAMKAESIDVTELAVSSSISGITGLPAIQGQNLVLVPLNLLSQPATNAVAAARPSALTASPRTGTVQLQLTLGDGSNLSVDFPLAALNEGSGWTAGLISGADLNKVRKAYDNGENTRHLVALGEDMAGAVVPVYIAKIVEGAQTSPTTTYKSTSPSCAVVYDKTANKMLLRRSVAVQLGGMDTVYYARWDAEDMAKYAAEDGTPLEGVIYETDMDGTYNMPLPYVYLSKSSTPALYTARVYHWLLRIQAQLDALMTSLSESSGTRNAAAAMANVIVPEPLEEGGEQ